MYACGLRASEAIGLELADVDLETGILRARGKGSKERLVPIGSTASRAVVAYLGRGRPRLAGDRDGAGAVPQPPRRPARPVRASTRSSSATRGPRGSTAR